jgi:pSer/pThr/pTyr-binding forkhead associated (FHA) protein
MSGTELLPVLRLALALLLYAFLALVFYAIWRDLQERARREPEQRPGATLLISTESQPDERFRLRSVTAIGRGQDNHVIVDDPFASSNHAVITWRENAWWIEDLNSHNGTFLNGELVARPSPLTAGDRINIGKTTLRFDTSP